MKGQAKGVITEYRKSAKSAEKNNSGKAPIGHPQPVRGRKYQTDIPPRRRDKRDERRKNLWILVLSELKVTRAN